MTNPRRPEPTLPDPGRERFTREDERISLAALLAVAIAGTAVIVWAISGSLLVAGVSSAGCAVVAVVTAVLASIEEGDQ